MRDNRERAEALLIDDSLADMVAGYDREDALDRLATALDAAEARGRAKERNGWLVRLAMLAARYDLRWFAIELRDFVTDADPTPALPARATQHSEETTK